MMHSVCFVFYCLFSEHVFAFSTLNQRIWLIVQSFHLSLFQYVTMDFYCVLSVYCKNCPILLRILTMKTSKITGTFFASDQQGRYVMRKSSGYATTYKKLKTTYYIPVLEGTFLGLTTKIHIRYNHTASEITHYSSYVYDKLKSQWEGKALLWYVRKEHLHIACKPDPQHKFSQQIRWWEAQERKQDITRKYWKSRIEEMFGEEKSYLVLHLVVCMFVENLLTNAQRKKGRCLRSSSPNHQQWI